MAVHPNSLANLRPARRGDVRNPRGVNGYTRDNTLANRYAATCQTLLTCENEEQRATLMEAIVRDVFDGAIRGDSRLLLRLVRFLLPLPPGS